MITRPRPPPFPARPLRLPAHVAQDRGDAQRVFLPQILDRQTQRMHRNLAHRRAVAHDAIVLDHVLPDIAGVARALLWPDQLTLKLRIRPPRIVVAILAQQIKLDAPGHTSPHRPEPTPAGRVLEILSHVRRPHEHALTRFFYS